MSELPLVPLSELLKQAFRSENGYIYLQGTYPWRTESLGVLCEADMYSDKLLEDEQPDFCKLNNLHPVMQTQLVEDLVRNAFLQKPDVTVRELIACFNNYYQNDSFLDLPQYRKEQK